MINYVFESKNAERSWEAVCWLKENGVDYDVSLNGKKYRIDIRARKLQCAMVQRFLREVR